MANDFWCQGNNGCCPPKDIVTLCKYDPAREVHDTMQDDGFVGMVFWRWRKPLLIYLGPSNIFSVMGITKTLLQQGDMHSQCPVSTW
jgi:hypothetical protein